MFRRTYKSISELSTDELRRKYEFLRLPKIPNISEADDRQRYLSARHFYHFMISSLLAAATVVVACLALATSHGRFTQLCTGSLLFAWPPNIALNNQLIAQIDSANSAYSSTSDICLLLSANGATSIIWMVWLGVRLITDATRNDHYRDGIPIWFIAVGAIFILFVAVQPLENSSQVFSANIVESPLVGVVKKEFMISCSYWSAGLLLFIAMNRLRSRFHLWRPRGTKSNVK